MFCSKCRCDKPEKGFKKRWCWDCRQDARKMALEYQKTHPKHLYGGMTYESRDMVLSELGFRSYRDYLCSSLWKSIRRRVFRVKGRLCSLCRGQATSVHHNRYHKNDLLGRTLRFLEPICDGCHEHLEFSRKGKKVNLYAARDKFDRRSQDRIRSETSSLISVLLEYDAEDSILA